MYLLKGYRVLTRQQGDINGDGSPDCVTITGRPVSEGGYSEDMVMLIQSGSTGKTMRVPVPKGSGYPPNLSIVNLTGSKGCDILLTIPTGGSGGTILAYAWRSSSGIPPMIFSPRHYNDAFAYRVVYLDNYLVEVSSYANDLRYTIDLSTRGADYLSQVYDSNGILLKPIEGWVDPLSGLYPVDFNGDGIYDLVAWQQIAGLYHADSLGFIQNVLTWNGAQFELTRQYLAIFGTEPAKT